MLEKYNRLLSFVAVWPRLVHEGRGMKATSNTSFGCTDDTSRLPWTCQRQWIVAELCIDACWCCESTTRNGHGAADWRTQHEAQTRLWVIASLRPWPLQCPVEVSSAVIVCVCARLLCVHCCPFFLFDSYVYFYSYFPIRMCVVYASCDLTLSEF